MRKTLILPIYERKSNSLSKLVVVLFICGFIGVFVNIFYLNNLIFNYFTIGLTILSGIFMGILKVDKYLGTIKLNEFEIIINDEEIIQIQDIQNLKISIGGCEGRRGIDNLRSLNADDGKNNFIEFVHNHTHKKFRILLSSQNDEAFKEIVRIWESQKIISS